MFSIHKKLFLALKKVWVVKITHPQVPITWKKFPQQNFHSPHYTHPLLLFGKPCSHKFLNNSINMSISVFQSSLSSMKIPKYLYGWWHTIVFYIIWAWDQCPIVSLKILQHLKSYFHSIRRQVVLSLFQVLC